MKNNLSKKLIKLSEKVRPILAILLPIYFAILICYDLFFRNRDINEIVDLYLKAFISVLIIYFFIRLWFWLQCSIWNFSEKFIDFFSLFALVFFSFGSIFTGIGYFLYGFNSTSFIGPVAIFSILQSQKRRNIS